MKKILVFIFILVILALPAVSFAQDSGPLVECKTYSCGFGDFMKMINRIIDFIFKFLAFPLAALMFAYAGFVLVTSGGSTEARSKAKNIFSDAVIGLMLAAGAWLIVKTLLSFMGFNDIGLFF